MGATITFDVEVLDGEGMAVPGVEVGARYRYRHAPRTWSVATTDRAGCARFRDAHEEPPEEVCLFVGDEDCGSYRVTDRCSLVLEM
jgi:hypothetical protein